MWRKPDEETEGLYPNLVVHDGRQTGAITVGRSRLPVSCFIFTALKDGWEEVEAGWSPTEHYGFTEHDLADFLTNLLNVRGEFGRLLLVLADAERREELAVDEVLAPYGPIVDITPGSGVKLPDGWWENDTAKQPVIEQLRRCLELLEGPRVDRSNPT